MKCKKCKWFEETEGRGYCHRYPPMVITYNTDGHDTVYPTVESDDFCGEFTEKKK